MGIQYEVHLTAASAYVTADEERQIAQNSDKEVSVAPSQGAPDAAPHEITITVNYTGETNHRNEGMQGRSISFLRGTG